jgi:iron complex transport system substrate-binding protein
LKTVSGGVLAAHMTCGVRSTGRLNVLAAVLRGNVFERSGGYGRACGLACLLLLNVGDVSASDDANMSVKRRQQGILTGMPFMANIASRTFVDDVGRKLYFAESPKRVLSLAPSITEMLFAIGLDEEIIGVTNFCNYPPAAAAKTKVGYTHPNVESLLALRPDMIAAPREFLRPDVLTKLDELKVPAFIFEAKSIEDVLAHIHTLGRIFKRTSAADAVTRHMRERLADITDQVNAAGKTRVLYVLSSQPLMTVGPESYIHQLIDLAGGINIAAGASGAYPRLNMETVLKENPEVLIFPGETTESVPESEQQTWTRWSGLSAVQHGRLHVVSSDMLNRPGPRVVDGLEQLARLIHPEVFTPGTTRSSP